FHKQGGEWKIAHEQTGCSPATLRVAEHAESPRVRGRLCTAARTELAQDRGDVVLDRAFGEEETLRDRRIAQAFAEKLQDLELARGELSRIAARRGARAAGDVSRAERAQAAGDDRRGCPSAEIGEQLERAPKCRFGRNV